MPDAPASSTPPAAFDAPIALTGARERPALDTPPSGGSPPAADSPTGEIPPVPAELWRNQPDVLRKKFLLWGSREVGKTMFLYGLVNAPGFNADPQDDAAWAYEEAAQARVTQLAALPGSTLKVAETHWRWDPSARRNEEGESFAEQIDRRSHSVTFVDIPGEWTSIDDLAENGEGRETAAERIKQLADEIVPHAEHADGMIFLLDPTGVAGRRLSQIGRLLRELNRRNVVPENQMAAIVLTKMDDETFLSKHAAYVTRDASSPGNIPYLTPTAARRLFLEELVKDQSSAVGAEARTLSEALAGFRSRGRLQYMAVSAAGFCLQGDRFDENSFSNVEEVLQNVSASQSAESSFKAEKVYKLRIWPEPRTQRVVEVLRWMANVTADQTRP